MALNINNPETERLARELARRRGQGITEVVTDALRHEFEREREALMRDVKEISERVVRLPILDDRSADEIIGYNEHGLFD
jgi:antitoxin VapB